jgi:hypothetical protein
MVKPPNRSQLGNFDEQVQEKNVSAVIREEVVNGGPCRVTSVSRSTLTTGPEPTYQHGRVAELAGDRSAVRVRRNAHADPVDEVGSPFRRRPVPLVVRANGGLRSGVDDDRPSSGGK